MNEPTDLSFDVAPDSRTTALVYRAGGSPKGAAMVVAHGAGAGQRSPFMTRFAYAVAALGIDVVTFNFVYAERGRRVPDRAPLLEACYRAAVETVRREVATARRALFIGGKSMGGRIATQVAAADRSMALAGLVLLGYPLHPPGRPEQRRDAHLPGVRRPMLFVQGSRDGFGTPDELRGAIHGLKPPPALHVVGGGDHSFKLSRKDAAAQAAIDADVQRTIADWVSVTLQPRRTAGAT